jgi:polyhydroxyalkanoate synthase
MVSVPIQDQVSQQNLNSVMEDINDKFFSLEDAMREKNANKRADFLDKIFRANLGMMSTGLSPAALSVAWVDWLAQLYLSPNKRLQLLQSAWNNMWGFPDSTLQSSQDHIRVGAHGLKPFMHRFHEEVWKEWPYCEIAKSFLRIEKWWQNAIDVRGMQTDHKELIVFMLYQWINALSPENQIFLNPKILQATIETNGQNIVNGFNNWQQDLLRVLRAAPPKSSQYYKVGVDVAKTPGKIVYRNRLFELIQYTPQTALVYSDPILIIPAWIMKYYILDLSPKNSMVDFLVKKGHTVFMMSWKNPDAEYRNYSMKDYLKKGIVEAYEAVRTITGKQQMHATGYCIGGTLLSIAASYFARKGKMPFKSLSLFAAQTDFDEPSELMTFIDESQLSYLEDIMYSQGYLRGDQMSAAFELLRPKELIWYKAVQRYLLGEKEIITDLLAWNEDTTRLPYKMHCEYLRHFHQNNDLVEGKYEIDGETILLQDINSPLFVVATENDHIAPWKSVYKIHLYAKADITFVLANKGHNGGIVSEPGHKNRSYRLKKTLEKTRYQSPEQWLLKNKNENGSWWLVWHDWLAAQSGRKIKPPPMGTTLGDAPGRYVKEK